LAIGLAFEQSQALSLMKEKFHACVIITAQYFTPYYACPVRWRYKKIS